MTRDAREVERKKVGLRKARKRPQYSSVKLRDVPVWRARLPSVKVLCTKRPAASAAGRQLRMARRAPENRAGPKNTVQRVFLVKSRQNHYHLGLLEELNRAWTQAVQGTGNQEKSMSSDGVNSGRRKFLTAATSVVGCLAWSA